MFKEFTVKDVLNVEQTKSVVAKADLTEGDIPYVTRTVSDNGYMGTCGNKDKVNKGNCITIGAETGVAFYQPNDFVAGNKVYRLSREGIGIKEYLFLASVLNMQTKNYSYSNARIPEKIKAEKMLLPVIENANSGHEYTADDIDWQYMRDRIAELERDRIAELERDRIAELDAYLKATGLDDYELTMDEEMALKGFFDGEVSFKEFRVDELFDSSSGDTDIKKEHINGRGVSVISAGVEHRGVIGKTDKSARVVSSPSMTVDMFGNAFYRDEAYKMVTHARVFALIPKGFEMDRHLGEFFEGRLSKIKEQFGYNNMCSFAKIRDTKLSLPVNSDGSINWKYIYIYIYERWRRKLSRKLSNTKRS